MRAAKAIFSELALPRIIQAPMAGGITTPALVAAVANCQGGIGSFGFALSGSAVIRKDLAAAMELTNGIINTNFFVWDHVETPSQSLQSEVLSSIKALNIGGLKEADILIPQPPYYPDLDAQLEPIWELRPSMLTFHFGLPPTEHVSKAKSLGISVGVNATSLAEGRKVKELGADFIVAQGHEAGGHRGTFDAFAADDTCDDTLSLVRKLAACELVGDIPIVAAGGIMTGSDTAVAMRAGAAAVQMGTAFLLCEEAGTSTVHQLALQQMQQRPTTLTPAFTGRRARAIENQLTKSLENQPVLPFPLQRAVTAVVDKAAASEGLAAEYTNLWAGENFGRIRGPLPARLLVDTLRDEYHKCVTV